MAEGLRKRNAKHSVLLWLSERWVGVLAFYTARMTVFHFFLQQAPGFYAPVHISLTLPVMIMAAVYGLGKHRLKYEISYGMYLYHFIVINAMIQSGVTDGFKDDLVTVPIAVLMGFAQNILIDKPMGKLRLK